MNLSHRLANLHTTLPLIKTEKAIPSSFQEHFEHLDQPLMPQDRHRRGSQSAWLNSVKKGGMRGRGIYAISSENLRFCILKETGMSRLVATSAVQSNCHQLRVEAFSCVGGFPSAEHNIVALISSVLQKQQASKCAIMKNSKVPL